nr:hypothetical protein [Tanacetum cinerariifolium]
MASEVICLATNQKFNFSKYIFKSVIKNLDSVTKFLMFLRGNISKTQSKETPNEPGSQGTNSGGGARCQEAIGDAVGQTRSKRVSKLSNDPLLIEVNTSRCGEDSLKLTELMELCTNLQNRVLDLETTKTTQAIEIEGLKKSVKKLKNKERLGKEDASKQGMIANINASEDITFVSAHDEQMFDADQDLGGEETQSKATPNEPGSQGTNSGGGARCQKAIGDAVGQTRLGKEDASKQGRIANINASEDITLVSAHDEQMFDADQVLGELQSKFEMEPRLASERAQQEKEANIKLIESWDDVQAKIEKKRKFFAAKRAEEKRNKPPTQAQQRKIMCTYLKNMEGKKLTDLKTKSFNSIQKMFDRAFKMGSSKRAATKLEQESYKKYKVEDDKDAAKLKQLVNIIPDEEGVAIDVIPLAVKPPSNADWKIHKKGKKTYYQIIKADGSLKIYLIFCHMLKDFDKEDVETLWKLVKAKYVSTRPERDYDRVLWGKLKVMFEPHIEHEVYKMLQRYKV